MRTKNRPFQKIPVLVRVIGLYDLNLALRTTHSCTAEILKNTNSRVVQLCRCTARVEKIQEIRVKANPYGGRVFLSGQDRFLAPNLT